MKVLSFALSEGAIAVHCHAGLGRTGVIIAAVLIFENGISAEQSIRHGFLFFQKLDPPSGISVLVFVVTLVVWA